MKIEDFYHKWICGKVFPVIFRLTSGMKFSYFDYLEYKFSWSSNYTPPLKIKKDDLILDVGARDLDSTFFFFKLGYRNFRVIEPNPKHWFNLVANSKRLIKKGARIELCLRRYYNSDLDNVSFAKFDCEGCESEIQNPNKIPIVMERHEIGIPDKSGTYPYSKPLGYLKIGYWE